MKRKHRGYGDTFFIDEVFVKINGKQYYLWRVVDQDGQPLANAPVWIAEGTPFGKIPFPLEEMRSFFIYACVEDLIAAGIVLTGGASKMEGVIELAEEIFHMPVSLGAPRNVSGLKDIVRNPVYATGVGLLQYGKEREEEMPGRGRLRGKGTFNRFKKWISENF